MDLGGNTNSPKRQAISLGRKKKTHEALFATRSNNINPILFRGRGNLKGPIYKTKCHFWWRYHEIPRTYSPLARQVLFVRNWSWNFVASSHFKASSCRSQQHPTVGKVRNLDERNSPTKKNECWRSKGVVPNGECKKNRFGVDWHLKFLFIFWFFLTSPASAKKLLRLAGKNLSNLRNRIGPRGEYIITSEWGIQEILWICKTEIFSFF